MRVHSYVFTHTCSLIRAQSCVLHSCVFTHTCSLIRAHSYVLTHACLLMRAYSCVLTHVCILITPWHWCNTNFNHGQAVVCVLAFPGIDGAKFLIQFYTGGCAFFYMSFLQSSKQPFILEAYVSITPREKTAWQYSLT